MALAVFTPILAACGVNNDSDDAAASSGDADTDSGETATDTTAQETTTTAQAEAAEETGDGVRWARANLGFVSAYVLARGNSAAIVDTGVAGSAAAIGDTLGTLGLTYDDVEHVILTHNHGDHAGSIAEVTAMASSAAVYAGEADLTGIDAEDIVPLAGGEDVFGLNMVHSPGHTAGHMAVFDENAGILVAGDALFTEDGGVIEGPERFFADVDQSRESIRQLAALSYNVLLPGHGEPIELAADTAVADLAASLS